MRHAPKCAPSGVTNRDLCPNGHADGPGHSQNGLAFASNGRANVRSDKLGVNRVMYQSAVEYHQSEQGQAINSTTTITLKKDKLWSP